jgi:HEAT repeat protein
MDPMRREIDDINRESSSIVRTEYAKKLSEFIKNGTRGDIITDRDIDILAGLMQDRDDSVRYWIAISLGFIGERAQRSVPALARALRDRACDHSSKTSASAIRLAFKRMGIAPPDIDCDR